MGMRGTGKETHAEPMRAPRRSDYRAEGGELMPELEQQRAVARMRDTRRSGAASTRLPKD
jgi:hypothetical protein